MTALALKPPSGLKPRCPECQKRIKMLVFDDSCGHIHVRPCKHVLTDEQVKALTSAGDI